MNFQCHPVKTCQNTVKTRVSLVNTHTHTNLMKRGKNVALVLVHSYLEPPTPPPPFFSPEILYPPMLSVTMWFHRATLTPAPFPGKKKHFHILLLSSTYNMRGTISIYYYGRLYTAQARSTLLCILGVASWTLNQEIGIGS